MTTLACPPGHAIPGYAVDGRAAVESRVAVELLQRGADDPFDSWERQFAAGPVPAPQPSDQGECRNSLLEVLGVRTNSDTSAAQRYCGISAVLASADGARRLARFACDSMHCRTCGERVRAERVTLYALAIARTPVAELCVTVDAWPTLQRRIERAGGDYLRVPIGAYVLVLTSAISLAWATLVHDVIGWLEDALARLVRGPRISTSRRWKLVGRALSGYRLVGISYEGPASMRAIAEATTGIDDDDHLLHADDRARWDDFRRRTGLHLPARQRKEHWL